MSPAPEQRDNNTGKNACATVIRTRPTPQARHRGGAWKVAYADFITALMALFIVMWMMSATAKVKASISGYFRDPRGFTHKRGTGAGGSGEGLRVNQTQTAVQVRDAIQAALSQIPEFQRLRENVQFSVTGEGLRIDLLETEQGMFFPTGSTTPTGAGVQLLETLGGELGRLPNRVVIEGHTDARPFRKGKDSSYNNWDLASDRANAARRLLYKYGIRQDQVAEVRGFADQKLLNPTDPNDARNRRVSVVVRFSEREGRE